MEIHILLRKIPGKTVMVVKAPDNGLDMPIEFVPPGQELDRLFTAAYEELKRLAATVRRDDRVTLSPTSLVDEAWVKLAASRDLKFESQLHFRRVAARAMRQVLVEAARHNQAARRGANPAFVTFDDSAEGVVAGPGEVIALNDALDELARLNPRQAQMVEARFFGGLDTSEIATLLGISEATVLRDWRAARAWLARELRT